MPQSEKVTAMQKPTHREWLALLLVPLATAALAAFILHVTTRPGTHYLDPSTWFAAGGQGRWPFRETFPQLLPTFLAVSFVYHLTILPYIRSHNRRSALLLTALSGPVFALWILVITLTLCSFIDPDVPARLGKFLFHEFWKYGYAIPSLVPLAIITAIFSFFTLSVALLASGCGTTARSPHPPDAVTAWRGFALIGAVICPLLFLWITEWKQASDRAGCILNIRNVQQAVRGHNGMNGINPGQDQAAGFLKNALIGPGKFIVNEPVCPAGGRYTWLENRTPYVGELMIRCSIPHHNPEDHHDW